MTPFAEVDMGKPHPFAQSVLDYVAGIDDYFGGPSSNSQEDDRLMLKIMHDQLREFLVEAGRGSETDVMVCNKSDLLSRTYLRVKRLMQDNKG